MAQRLVKRTGDNSAIGVSHQLGVQVEGPGVSSGNGGGPIGGVDSGDRGSSIGGVSHDSFGGEMLSPGSGNSGLINCGESNLDGDLSLGGSSVYIEMRQTWNYGSVGMSDEAIERGGCRHAGGETTSNNLEKENNLTLALSGFPGV